MSKQQEPPTVEITKKHAECGTIEGSFTNFPGWTFTARVEEGINWDSDVCTNFACTRISDVSIAENGEDYISIPGDYYDGRDIPLQAAHEQMLDQIDLFFGPSPDERLRLLAERDVERDRVFEALSEFIEQQLSEVSPDTLCRAASKLEDVYRDLKAG